MGRAELGSKRIKAGVKKTQFDFSENQSPTRKELYMSEEESELSKAKKTVRDLTLKIEQSNSKGKLRIQEFEKMKIRRRGQEEKTLGVKKINNFANYAEVMRDLEKIKRDLSKLKLEMKGALEQKNRAENEAKSLNLKIYTYTESVYALREEIDELNDELILVELAEIEASKELADIEAQKELEAQNYLSKIENTKTKMKEILEEIDRLKEIENKLALTNSDIEMLENEIKMFKEIDIRVRSFREEKESDMNLVLILVKKELELAKKELASIREDGFQLMASMDVIRTELVHFSEKTARLKKKHEKSDQNVQNLKLKVLRAKTKLEAISSSEEKAKTIVENIFATCENLKTEIEGFNKEKELIYEETVKIKAITERNEEERELAEIKLEAALQELEGIKSSELLALEKLKNLTENTMLERAFRSKHSSKITISKFEYDYLMSRAAEAEKVGDLKVSAAQAWIEAFETNEEEIKMETEIAERKMREEREEEDMERLLREKSTKNSDISTNVRRAKLRIPTSPGVRYMSRSPLVNIKRREKIMPNLGNLSNGEGMENEW